MTEPRLLAFANDYAGVIPIGDLTFLSSGAADEARRVTSPADDEDDECPADGVSLCRDEELIVDLLGGVWRA